MVQKMRYIGNTLVFNQNVIKKVCDTRKMPPTIPSSQSWCLLLLPCARTLDCEVKKLCLSISTARISAVFVFYLTQQNCKYLTDRFCTYTFYFFYNKIKNEILVCSKSPNIFRTSAWFGHLAPELNRKESY